MNENISKNYWIVDRNLASFEHELAKLNRRAARLNVAPIQYRKTGQKRVEEQKSEVTGLVVRVIEYSEVEVSGQAPKFAGWSLAAVIEHTPEGNILRKSPDCSLELAAYRAVKPLCEHCKTVRNRKDTYLVVHDDGSIKQIGHDCIKDFLGHKDPHALAHLAELWFSLGELAGLGEDYDGFGMGSSDDSIYAKSFYAFAALAIRRFGYVSRKYQQEHPEQQVVTTREMVMTWMFPSREDLERARRKGEEWPHPEEQDVKFAEAACEHVQNELGQKENLSDFESNILIASKLEVLERRTAGIAAYVPEHYRRSIQQAEERKAKQAESNNAHFGEVGKRYRNVKLVYTGSVSWDSEFGTQYRHNFFTADKIKVSWKTGTCLGLDAGTEVEATFTVKNHGDYKGWKQTDISRLVIN